MISLQARCKATHEGETPRHKIMRDGKLRSGHHISVTRHRNGNHDSVTAEFHSPLPPPRSDGGKGWMQFLSIECEPKGPLLNKTERTRPTGGLVGQHLHYIELWSWLRAQLPCVSMKWDICLISLYGHLIRKWDGKGISGPLLSGA